MPDQTPNRPVPEDRSTARAKSTDDTTATGSSGAGTAPRPAPPKHGAMTILIPAVAFLVGLLLGGTLMWVGAGQDDGEAAGTPTPSPAATSPQTTSPTERPDATVTVPGSCLDLADSAEVVADLVQDAATAAQELDAAELSSIVRELQESQSDIEGQTSACRSEAGS